MPPPLLIETRILDERIGRDFPAPQYATALSAGIDLCACINQPQCIDAGEVRAIKSGIAISIGHPDYMAVLAPRSGLGIKHGIVLANTVGIIDADYQGEIQVALFNRSNKSYEISPGERICQLIIIPIKRATIKVVSHFSQTTIRGDGGFGSTGKF